MILNFTAENTGILPVLEAQIKTEYSQNFNSNLSGKRQTFLRLFSQSISPCPIPEDSQHNNKQNYTNKTQSMPHSN